MHDLPHLPCSNLAPFIASKQGKNKIKPNSNMCKANKQTNM